MGGASAHRRHVACLLHAREIGSMTRTAALWSLGIRPPGRPGDPVPLPRRHGSRPSPRPPVLLVPGYGGNRSNWHPLEHRLQELGYVVHTLVYDPEQMDIHGIAQQLVGECRRTMRSAGAHRVHVVGHSLGGVVVRYAVQQLGLAEHVRVAVTVASPHRGTAVARFGRGRAAMDLRPGSALLARLHDESRPDGVRWLSYWSDTDVVVHPRSARLADESLDVEHILVRGAGHLSILRSPGLVSRTAEQMMLADMCATADGVSAVAPLACAA